MRRVQPFLLVMLAFTGCDAFRGDADFEAKLTGSTFDSASFRGDATAATGPATEGREYTISLIDPDAIELQMVYASSDPLQGCTYTFVAREPRRANSPEASITGSVETTLEPFNQGANPDTTVYSVSLEVQYRSDTVIEGRLRVDGFIDRGLRPDRGNPEGNPRFEITGRFKARGENLMPDISDTIRPCP